jgi:hypothetical protein
VQNHRDSEEDNGRETQIVRDEACRDSRRHGGEHLDRDGDQLPLRLLLHEGFCSGLCSSRERQHQRGLS